MANMTYCVKKVVLRPALFFKLNNDPKKMSLKKSPKRPTYNEGRIDCAD